ncbi:response regulator [uncultured Roseovarius sp.]|mgnify:CR=1 FL=1|uniref:response regulator n=1 Tax=uncultured Roseovarius sp. TaxID=293344 RepID=UPI0025E367AC|nr:response regulator [uncultured Roseovarius sp.]
MVNQRKILVVDDDAINRMVVRVLMERRNYSVVEAASGPEALELVKDETFDVALMDLSMPGMDGLETTRHIRSNAAGSQLPVVALTAHTSQRDQRMCLEAGMNAVLRKPFDSEQVDMLLGLLDHSTKGPGI